MAFASTKISLQKILKEGLRRCVYRRWEGSVSGKVLRTRTIELERMYRGNTPYPITKSPITQTLFSTPADALAALRRRMTTRRAQGYAPYFVGRRNRNADRS